MTTQPDSVMLSSSLVDEKMDDLISDLQTLIRQPSISAINAGLEECALLLSNIMNKSGIKTELLYLEESSGIKNYQTNALTVAPVVFGEVRSKSNPNGRTILFYNHYDVQPVDPIENWESDPFSGKVDGNLIFGRGSSDDKGEIITRLKAVEFFLKETGDVPCNIKFLLKEKKKLEVPI